MTPPLPPLVVFEDNDLLVIEKPSGVNTHSAAPYASEGVHEWLKRQNPRWAKLAIIHRLDKETSGLMVFGKTPEANRSLTEQFALRKVHKVYTLWTDRPVPSEPFTVQTKIGRVGETYSSKYKGPDAQVAVTEFRKLSESLGVTLVSAHPLTGRTHQIRVHASENGFPIIGDPLYGGSPAERLRLYATELRFTHPATGKEMGFTARTPHLNAALGLRSAFINSHDTNACRLIHGAADRLPGVYVDRWGDYLLATSERDLSPAAKSALERLARELHLKGAAHKMWRRDVKGAGVADASPQPLFGEFPTAPFNILENGLRYEISFQEGYSVGLFLDQRDNRRSILSNYAAAGFPLFEGGLQGKTILNTFAYTCGFSLCAARAGATTASLDLSEKYLHWGERNFAHNNIPAAAHDFIYGDTFNWLGRFAKKQRSFDMIILDPPTFSKSKEHGVFQAERDYGRLVEAALPVLKKGGILFASTNAAKLSPADFLAQIRAAFARSRRAIKAEHYAPQPPDFPASREEPAYLKTVWLRAG